MELKKNGEDQKRNNYKMLENSSSKGIRDILYYTECTDL